MSDIFTLIDNYKELLDEKDRLKDATTENNKALEDARKELAQAMIDAESPKVSRNGFLYSLQDKTRYSKIGGCDEEAFFATLEENGLGDIIKRTVNGQRPDAAGRDGRSGRGERRGAAGGVRGLYKRLPVLRRTEAPGNQQSSEECKEGSLKAWKDSTSWICA